MIVIPQSKWRKQKTKTENKNYTRIPPYNTIQYQKDSIDKPRKEKKGKEGLGSEGNM